MNKSLVLRDRDREVFELGIQLIFLQETTSTRPTKCVGYSINNGVLKLYQFSDDDNPDYVTFPYPLNLEQTKSIAWGFYENNMKPNEQEPRGSGSTEVGFEISTEFRPSEWNALCLIRSVWFYYGK